ncbi:polymorphic toxin-type HINT domain-containing protein [Streptomyces sp. CBMA156]|uniref:polymorphic toxin-type HINT domain-containing protein n=1 Tax=Streptomyces sp. CBMA156 TaxID=1930280 RepID=UPI001661FFCD|nr:polymorphic toxin-type HINT domain-containing protein [Streptomyces sp. CBMA156]MBD0676162.1 hypothetical protein [Streptomyces sp. CBMA156]
MERRVRRTAAAALSCAFLAVWAVCQVLLGTATGTAQPVPDAPPAIAAPAAPAPTAPDAARARSAAARAKTAAKEATRAANATVAIANQASSAATEAQGAANEAASHAEAAATAAEEAARHAGDANTQANIAQTAATAADTSANSAAASATQAHKVADIARASDAERLAAQQATEMATADEASREADQKAKAAAWESGKATKFAADTEQLVKDATAPGADPKAVVLKGRQVAFRLLDTAGPWTKAAAQSALEGDDTDVQTFLASGLTTARDYDDRTSALAITQSAGKLELRLAAETAAVGTTDQVRAFLATGQYPGKDDDDRVALSQIMANGGPGVKEAAGKALDGTIDDVRAFLTTGQYKARDDDNRVLVSRALANGGPEVKAAAQAVLSGPTDRLEPFLKTGLPKAQQRDAMTAAHVATIASYLASIDGSVAQARQYAAQAAQSSATARGAANEAAGYASTAKQSAQQAQAFSNQAAQSAQAAQTSAQQAAGYAKQAQTAAATANAAARSANFSAAAATRYADQASKYAADAKDARDRANASAVAAGKSRDEANKAAAEAWDAFYTKQCTSTLAGALESQTATVDDQGRISYIEGGLQGDPKTEVIQNDLDRCAAGDMMLSIYGNEIKPLDTSVWHLDPAGKPVCTLHLTVRATGTTSYTMRTCPEPGLSITACTGKYTTWNTVLVSSNPLDVQYPQTIELTYGDYLKHYKPKNHGVEDLWAAVTKDIVDCYHNPGPTSACAWAASNLIPYGTLAKGAKAVVAFRYALETGIGIEDAKLAVQASLDGYNKAALAKLTATADAVANFRNSLKTGTGTDAALEALRQDRNVERSLVQQLEAERDISVYGQTCPIVPPGTLNSFPAGTAVLMGDGTTRPIETISVGDLVTATDPVTGVSGPRAVTNTIYTPDDRDFTELTVDPGNGPKGSVTATDHHPFWVESTRTWTDAAAVQVGDTLRTDNGATAQVASIRHWTALQPAYNLTVADLHTYYVLAGNIALLAHNASLECYRQVQKIADKLPNWVKNEKTKGFVLTREADDIINEAGAIQSGYSKSRDAIDAYLQTVGFPKNSSIVADVEVKLAWRMKEVKRKTLEIVINKPGGPCTGTLSCAVAVPKILPKDYTLIVWYKNELGVLADEPIRLKGAAEDFTG